MIKVQTTDVGKHHFLEVAPYSLRRVEVGRVGRKDSQLDASCSSFREPFSHLLSSVNAGTIPHQPDKPWYLREQVVQKRCDVLPIKCAALRSEVEGSLLADSSYSRQVISAQPFPKERSLTFGCPGSNQGRERSARSPRQGCNMDRAARSWRHWEDAGRQRLCCHASREPVPLPGPRHCPLSRPRPS